MKTTKPRIAKNGKNSAAKKQRSSTRALLAPVFNKGVRALHEDDFKELMRRICERPVCNHEDYIAAAVLEKMTRDDDVNKADELLVEVMRKGDAVQAAGSKVKALLNLMLAEHRSMEISLRLPPSNTEMCAKGLSGEVEFWLKNSLAELQDVVGRVTVLYSGMLARVNESARAQG